MNLAPIGKLLRDGLIDGFQARAMIDRELKRQGFPGSLSDLRFRMFYYRWAVKDGSHADSRESNFAMIYGMGWAKLPGLIHEEA